MKPATIRLYARWVAAAIVSLFIFVLQLVLWFRHKR